MNLARLFFHIEIMDVYRLLNRLLFYFRPIFKIEFQ
jgi:hypothetical protein